MIRDEAIEEMRERRRRMMDEHYDGSIERLIDEAEQWQWEHPDRVVRPERERKTHTP